MLDRGIEARDSDFNYECNYLDDGVMLEKNGVMLGASLMVVLLMQYF